MLSSGDLSFSILIRHELWHAANSAMNQAILEPSAKSLASPFPFAEPKDLPIFEARLKSSYRHVDRLRYLNKKHSLGRPFDHVEQLEFTKLRLKLSNYRSNIREVITVNNLAELQDYNVKPRKTKGGKLSYKGSTVIYKDGIQDKIVKIENIKSSGYKVTFRPVDGINNFLSKLLALENYVKTNYGHNSPAMYLMEVDCYIHTTFPADVRAVIFPELEQYHKDRFARYQEAIAQKQTGESPTLRP